MFSLSPEERFDYNHRGKLQVLMHGLVVEPSGPSNNCQYEILHGNELMGVTPGQTSDRASDHAYVIARLPW